ncbi:MAG: 2-amino-4-hydroxy-6-hydroxymethyldihydropteridine diphosphokinase [Flavobacteriales bacterium]
MSEVIVLLGGNMGDPANTLAIATALIARHIGPIVAQSRDHWTEPWGFEDDRLFLNKAIIIATTQVPEAVMEELMAIERELGRERSPDVRYSARSIDLDILFIGSEVIDRPGLTVPHPRVHQRTFALGPSADIAPALIHPLLGRSVLDLLNDLLKTR